MKKYFYISALALASVASLTSCDDFLQAENKSTGGQTFADYVSTEAGLESYRVYAYSLLPALVNTSYNDMYDNASDIYWQSRGKNSSYDYFTQTAEDSDIKNFYSACYNMINACNGVISYGGSKYSSEMKFLRAYGYYLLTQEFGPVPFITSYINDANRNYPRTDLNEIYSSLLADLDEVAADENIADISHDGTVNKKAAYALAAKIALAAGWDLQTTLVNDEQGTYTINGTDFFSKSAAYAEKALDGVSLISSYEEKWSPYNEGNSEEFFAAQYDRASYPGDESDGGHSLNQDYGNYYGVNTDGMKTSSSSKGPSLKSLYLWDKGDERYSALFMGTHYNYNGSDFPATGYYAYYASSKLEDLNIAYYYAPWYTTEEEFYAFIDANKDRFAYHDDSSNPSCSYVKSSSAYLMGNPTIVVSFNADGSYVSFDEKGKEVKNIAERNYTMSDLLGGVNGTDCVKKWDDPNTLLIQQKSYRDIVILHASETILTAAEAYLMSGNSSKALEYVNKIRSRAKAETLSSFESYDPAYNNEGGYDVSLSAIDVILDERARELYAEPGRWFDLRRTKQMVKYNIAFNWIINSVSQMSNGMGEIKWLRPIPSDEISANFSISVEDQNSGY